jgi:4-amino-4-deoxy-L-arabinose transferase-like glycosyltransferase
MTDSRAVSQDNERIGRLGWSILFVLTAVAFFMRFYRLESLPPGLFYDEAFNGVDVWKLAQTSMREWPVFLTGNQGREALFHWMMALLHRVNGLSIWNIRAVSALSGALLTPALIWLAWEVAPWLGVKYRRSFALWSGAAVLALLWSQVFSRYGIRLALFVLIETLLWASLWRAWAGGKQTADHRPQTAHDPVPSSRHLVILSSLPPFLFWSLTGLFAGLSVYTYLPARLLPLILLPLIVIAFWQERDRLRSHLSGLAVTLVVAVLVAAPIGIYFWENPVSFVTRVEQVTIIGREGRDGAQGFGANLGAVAGMFTGTGDANPRSNVPGRPALDWLLAPFFLLGLLLTLLRFWRLAHFWLLTGLVVMLLPTLLSEFAPSFQRAIGAIPFVALLVALGLDGATGLATRLWRRGRIAYLVAGWLLIAASCGLTWRAYFVEWAGLPDLFPAWDVGFTRVAEEIAADDDGVRTYITPRGREHPTLAYLLTDHPGTPQPTGFDGRICVRVATDVPARYYVLVNEDFRAENLLSAIYPASEKSTPVVDANGAPWANRIDQPAGGAVVFPEMQPQAVALSDGIALLGHQLFPPAGMRAGDTFYTRLYWQVSATPTTNYTAFAHLLVRNENGDLVQLAGADRPPGEGSCPTTEWLPGEVVIDELQFALPADLPAGDLFVSVGFYTTGDQQRLSVPGTADNQVLIGPLTPAQ